MRTTPLKFAHVNNSRTQPSPRLRGVCCYCGEPTVSRCGSKRVWHWAHFPNRHCDPWWENETVWHRKWKGYFPEKNQEIVRFDSATGEKHIADVKTDDELVIEFQNSPMDPVELQSREQFYGDMIWLINGQKFEDNFSILDPLPDPSTEFAQDIVFQRRKAEWRGRSFWRLSENRDHLFDNRYLVLLHDFEEIQDEIEQHYVGHHLFDWKRPRSVWFDAQKPVYIDFGSDDFVLQLKIYRTYCENPLWCVQYISKKFIIESNGGVYTSPENANFPPYSLY